MRGAQFSTCEEDTKSTLFHFHSKYIIQFVFCPLTYIEVKDTVTYDYKENIGSLSFCSICDFQELVVLMFSLEILTNAA